VPEIRKSRKGKEIRDAEEGLSAHLQRADEEPQNTAEMPPDLGRVVAAWSHIPEAVKAGIEYRDAGGRVADFHALRHTYISRLVRSGANVKVAQELARHSTPTLTLGRYAHVQLVDQTRALDALPAIDSARRERESLRATGTAGVFPIPPEP